MSNHDHSLTPWKKVLLYYPQRVQVLALAGLNLLFIIAEEASAWEPSTVLVGAVNAFVLAVLVFFYGEHMTHSKQAVEDFFKYEASPESEVEYEQHGIEEDPNPEPEPPPPPVLRSPRPSPPVKKAATKKAAKKSTAKKSTTKKSAPKKKANP